MPALLDSSYTALPSNLCDGSARRGTTRTRRKSAMIMCHKVEASKRTSHSRSGRSSTGSRIHNMDSSNHENEESSASASAKNSSHVREVRSNDVTDDQLNRIQALCGGSSRHNLHEDGSSRRLRRTSENSNSSRSSRSFSTSTRSRRTSEVDTILELTEMELKTSNTSTGAAEKRDSIRSTRTASRSLGRKSRPTSRVCPVPELRPCPVEDLSLPLLAVKAVPKPGPLERSQTCPTKTATKPTIKKERSRRGSVPPSVGRKASVSSGTEVMPTSSAPASKDKKKAKRGKSLPASTTRTKATSSSAKAERPQKKEKKGRESLSSATGSSKANTSARTLSTAASTTVTRKSHSSHKRTKKTMEAKARKYDEEDDLSPESFNSSLPDLQDYSIPGTDTRGSFSSSVSSSFTTLPKEVFSMEEPTRDSNIETPASSLKVRFSPKIDMIPSNKAVSSTILWYSKQDLHMLVSHELRINMRCSEERTTKESSHACWRGLEHIRDNYNKALRIACHVRSVLQAQEELQNQQLQQQCHNSSSTKAKLVNMERQLARRSVAETKADRVNANAIAMRDACEVQAERARVAAECVRNHRSWTNGGMDGSSTFFSLRESRSSSMPFAMDDDDEEERRRRSSKSSRSVRSSSISRMKHMVSPGKQKKRRSTSVPKQDKSNNDDSFTNTRLKKSCAMSLALMSDSKSTRRQRSSASRCTAPTATRSKAA